MRFRELVKFNEQSNMTTTIASLLQKEKETGQAIKSQTQPQSQTATSSQSGTTQPMQKQTSPTGTMGTQGSSTVSKPVSTQEKPKTPVVQPPLNVPTGTRIEPVVSTKPNILKFKMDDAVFSLDTKDPQNTQLLQKLQAMGVKDQS